MIDYFNQVRGTDTKYVEVPFEKYNTLYENAEVMGNMFKWFHEFGYYGKKENTIAPNVQLTSFTEYVDKVYGQ